MTNDDGAECWHDMRPSVQLPSVSGVYSKLGLIMVRLSLQSVPEPLALDPQPGRRRRRLYVFGSSVRACVRDSRGSFIFPRYLQYLLTDFRQTFVTGASRDRDDLITFLGQKVKVQGHAIPARHPGGGAQHSTRRYRRVQLFLVFWVMSPYGTDGQTDWQDA